MATARFVAVRLLGRAVTGSLILGATAAIAASPAATPAAWAAPTATCERAEPAVPVVRPAPWPQRLLSPERVWPFTTGQGVVVAVVDSGVDAAHPQLAGAVLPGFDLVESGDGRIDCISHGTAVASIIAARRAPGVGFVGLAPGSTIVPVRVVVDEAGDDPNGRNAPPAARVAQAIIRAVDRGAKVVNVSIVLEANHPQLRAAVEYAAAKDALVVAAVGNGHDPERGAVDPPVYPAALAGVIGVGAVTPSGARLPASQVGSYVDLVAPGESVLAAHRLGGHIALSGTSFAAAFVSATAALVRAYRPNLTARQVARRLIATASSPAGPRSVQYGYGMVDPYRAVTEAMTDEPARAAPPVPSTAPDPAVVAARQRRADAERTALITIVVGGTLVALATSAAVVIPRGRRRRWRPTRATPPPGPPALDEPGVPPEVVFAVPSATEPPR